MIRLVPDHSARIKRSSEVWFTFDGERLQGHEGENLVAALLRSGRIHLRDAPEDGKARGAFCLMGLCQECIVQVDGERVESCRLAVKEGLTVTSVRLKEHG